MKKKILLIGLLIIVLAFAIIFYLQLPKQLGVCTTNDDCILQFSHCSCSYSCIVKPTEPLKDCAVVCGNASIPPGPEPKCACSNFKCVRNLEEV